MGFYTQIATTLMGGMSVALSGVLRLPEATWGWAVRAWRARLCREHLSRMTVQELEDIGMTRADIAHAVRSGRIKRR